MSLLISNRKRMSRNEVKEPVIGLWLGSQESRIRGMVDEIQSVVFLINWPRNLHKGVKFAAHRCLRLFNDAISWLSDGTSIDMLTSSSSWSSNLSMSLPWPVHETWSHMFFFDPEMTFDALDVMVLWRSVVCECTTEIRSLSANTQNRFCNFW